MVGPENSERSEHPVSTMRHLPKVYVNPFGSLHDVVERVIATMDEGPDAVSVVGFPKRIYCFRHPQAINKIFTDRGTGGAKYLPKIAWLNWFYRSGGFARPIDEVWRQRRRAIQPAFSADAFGNILPAFQAVAEERTTAWSDRLRETPEIKVEMYREFWEIVVDASFRAFFSTKLGDRLGEVVDMSQYIEHSFVEPVPLWLPLERNRRFKRDGDNLRQLFRELLARRRAEEVDGPRDVLGFLISESQSGSSLANDEAIVDEMASLYFGMCVMAVSLAWAIYLLASHPEVQAKVREEADQFAISGTEGRARRSLGYQYTTQVFHEISRLLPPVWGLPRYTAEADEIMGYAVPAKTVVVPMVFLAHRDARFWPDPKQFDPNRFGPHGTTPEKSPAYFPYGLGIRKCTGANIAPMIMQLFPLVMLSRVEMDFMPRFVDDPVKEFGFEVTPRDGLPITLRVRK